MALPLLTLLLRMGTTLWTRELISPQMGLKAWRHPMWWLAALLPSSC